MQYALPLTEQMIAARLERLPYSRWHVRITIILGVAIFFDSFDSLAIAYVLPVVIRDWSIAPEKVGALLSIANFGQAVGAFAFGWIAERVGRVPAVRITIALYAVMSFACAFAQTYDQLFWFRFVEGIGLGGEIPVASSYISEILRAQRRGSSFLAYQMIFPVGLLGAALAGAAVVPSFGWRWMFIIGAVPALIALVLRHFCPESPRWLACKGRLREADEVVTHIERIVSRNGAQPLPPLPQINARSAASKTRLRELFAGRYARRTLLVWVVWASSYIISYGLQGWIPTLYREIYHLTLQQSLNYAVAAPLGSLLGLWAIGARTALGMLLGYGFLSMWLGSINMSIFLYTAEIYPTRMRALGVSWASFWLRVAATVGPLVVGFALPRYGISGVFLIFSIFALTGGIAAIFMVETGGRVLEEVSP